MPFHGGRLNPLGRRVFRYKARPALLIIITKHLGSFLGKCWHYLRYQTVIKIRATLSLFFIYYYMNVRILGTRGIFICMWTYVHPTSGRPSKRPVALPYACCYLHPEDQTKTRGISICMWAYIHPED